MAEGNVFDIVLFGFRNDLAAAQALDYLSQLPHLEAGPLRLDRDTAMPQRLFAALDPQRAQRIYSELQRLGAQVALLDAGTPAESVVPVPDSPLPVAIPPAPQRTGIRRFTLVLVLALAATANWYRTTERLRLPPAPALVQPQMEPLRGASELVSEPATAAFNAEAVRLTESGQFREAADRLHMALSLAPQDPVLTRNLQTVLLNWGIAELAAQQLDDASDHLRQAARLGERAEVSYALGIIDLRQGDYAAAAATLEDALRMAPTDANVMLALAQVYLKQDQRPQALDLLARAKEAGATGSELDKTLQQLSREVDAEWDFVQLESPHFVVSFADSEDRRSVGVVLDALEDAYDAVGDKFHFTPDGRTPVVLYTQQDFHTITQTPDWAGAAFDGRIKLPVRGLSADDPNLARIIRHEYAHSLVAQLAGARCPVWLNEGLAVWAEEEQDGDHEAWAERAVAGKELFTLDALTGSFTRLPARRVETAYAESYLAVRTLIDRYGTRRIAELLRALDGTRSISEAFSQVYPGDLGGFQQQLLRQLAG